MTQHKVPVYVQNNTGEVLSNVHYLHRYDSDIYERGSLDILDHDQSNIIGSATYWTGFGRSGYDYWWIEFTRAGTKYTCKANFYCYLTSDDAAGKVTLILSTDTMQVVPYSSSSCKVSLYEESALFALIAKERETLDSVQSEQPCDCKEKS